LTSDIVVGIQSEIKFSSRETSATAISI
jgi:hypothetical protein